MRLVHYPARIGAPGQVDTAFLAAARRLADRMGFEPRAAELTHQPPGKAEWDSLKTVRRAQMRFTQRKPKEAPRTEAAPKSGPQKPKGGSWLRRILGGRKRRRK